MRKTVAPSFVAAVLATTVAAGPAAATDKGPYTVRAGVPTIVLSYATYDPETCTFATMPVLKVVRPPAHGTVTLGKSAHVAETGACAGKTFKSSVASYRANPGYHGPDSIVIDAEMEMFMNAREMGPRTDRMNISIVVK